MTTIEKRALYNLLRLNWLNDSSMKVEEWQVENYSLLTNSQLFDRLSFLNFVLDKPSFVIYADDCDSPEELAFHLTADLELTPQKKDHIYLLIFELWRRLVTEKPSLSILCHEMDEQIYLYDQGEVSQLSVLQDTLNQFIKVLDQNVDQNLSPDQAFKLLLTYCANDVETFLYDFISEQIEEENVVYASELLEDFDVYLSHNKWFQLLHLQLYGYSTNKTSQHLIEEILDKHLNVSTLDFKLEFLSLLVQKGDPLSFHLVLKSAFSSLQTEEEWQDLLIIAIQYLHGLDQKLTENTLIKILKERASFSLNSFIDKRGADFKQFIKIFNI